MRASPLRPRPKRAEWFTHLVRVRVKLRVGLTVRVRVRVRLKGQA